MKRQALIALLDQNSVVRSRDIKKFGIARTYLQRLQAEGVLVRKARGTYRLASSQDARHTALADAACRVPRGVVCLASALEFHNVGPHHPDEIWMAVDRKAWKPRVSDLPIRVVRFSGKALIEGVERHQAQGAWFSVYSLAKTVTDCFKYRNKIGLHVGLEALRDCRRRRLCAVSDLWYYAGINRVQRVMKPYVEAIG
ncbi:MAG TPA: type IV toxin-antitoxin system AbiEi family antitoxin domain-containing protein [Gemmatimonadales bacterium]|nr:type IV toxin-antitoxin system AbiEi family antitoxin domain-containing protein [Gemmatimonadales bacterium]